MATCASSFQGLPLSGGTLTGPLTAPGLTSTAHLNATGTAPGAAAGANAGTGPPSPVVAAGSTDVSGNVTFGTGTAPAAGAQCVVTFATSYGANPPGVSAEWANAASAALGQLYVTVTAGGFTVNCTVAPTASQANTTYAFSYDVIG